MAQWRADGIKRRDLMYYHTCPHCGANLAPNERCDCRNALYGKNKESGIEDRENRKKDCKKTS